MCVIVSEQSDVDAFKSFTADSAPSSADSGAADAAQQAPSAASDSSSVSTDYPPHMESKQLLDTAVYEK